MAFWQYEDLSVVADRACWAMFASTSVVVGLRAYCRAHYGAAKGGGLGMDDLITFFCLAVFLVTCILITIGSQHGLGKHAKDLLPQEVAEAMKFNAIISSILIWTFSLPKFAIILTIQRILMPGIKTKIMFWALALSSQACILATSIWWFKQCDPIEKGWNPSVEGTCAPVSVMANLGYFTSAYSAFLDTFFALYPIPFIMRLNMPLKSRIAVSVALGLSVLACAVSIYKLCIFGQVFEILAVDPTYPVPFLDILGMAEGTILMICASLPSLGPLFRICHGKITSYSRSRGTTQLSGTLYEQEIVSQGGRGGWDNIKDHKLDSDVEGQSALNLRPSFDAIPLVTSHKDGFSEAKLEGIGIHKTVEVSVSSEHHLPRGPSPTL